MATAASQRYDALAQFKAPAATDTAIDVRALSRTFWASVLLVGGIGVTIWLVVLIHAAVFRPHTVGLLERLAPAKAADLTLTLPSGKVELPPAGMTVLGYLSLILLGSIAAKLAAVMV